MAARGPAPWPFCSPAARPFRGASPLSRSSPSASSPSSTAPRASPSTARAGCSSAPTMPSGNRARRGVRKLVDVHRHLGQAGIGPRDILAADFGPTNAFQGPKDERRHRLADHARRAGGPCSRPASAIPMRSCGCRAATWLVSDDATDRIYRLVRGRAEIWSTAVPFPNGMALSRDGRTLYVAQIFSAIGPVVPDTAIWAIPIRAAAPPARRGSSRGPAGAGRAGRGRAWPNYIADNGRARSAASTRTGEMIVIAEDMPRRRQPGLRRGPVRPLFDLRYVDRAGRRARSGGPGRRARRPPESLRFYVALLDWFTERSGRLLCPHIPH